MKRPFGEFWFIAGRVVSPDLAVSPLSGATRLQLQERQGCLGSEGGGRILGEASEKVPCLEARSELFAVKRWAQQMTLEREVLADGTEAREESLRALGPAKTSHASLAFTGGLMAVLRAVVRPSAGLHEQVADVRKLRELAFAAG